VKALDDAREPFAGRCLAVRDGFWAAWREVIDDTPVRGTWCQMHISLRCYAPMASARSTRTIEISGGSTFSM